MTNTLKNLEALLTPKYNNMTLEELSAAYIEDKTSPLVFAAAFCKLYKLSLNISKNYFGLTSEDVASYTLEVLDNCLRTFDPDKAQFSTYFTNSLNFWLRKKTQELNAQKRKVSLCSVSLDDLVDVYGFDIPVPEVNDRISVIMEELNDYSLTQRELNYCNLVMQGYKPGEITDILGVSAMTLSNMRKSMRRKLSPALAL